MILGGLFTKYYMQVARFNILMMRNISHMLSKIRARGAMHPQSKNLILHQ